MKTINHFNILYSVVEEKEFENITKGSFIHLTITHKPKMENPSADDIKYEFSRGSVCSVC